LFVRQSGLRFIFKLITAPFNVLPSGRISRELKFFSDMVFKKSLLVAIACLPGLFLSAQSKAPDNWFNLDPTADKVNGTGGDAAIQMLKNKSKKSQTVIVAVLDSGVEIDHEDLKDVIWTNPGEIPGNKKDDDNNGYVDDVHGWNFLAGPGGNVNHETLARQGCR
jgi:cell wall-associated protease